MSVTVVLVVVVAVVVVAFLLSDSIVGQGAQLTAAAGECASASAARYATIRCGPVKHWAASKARTRERANERGERPRGLQ